MSKEKNYQNLIMGANVAWGILGTLSALMRPNRVAKGWKEKAKDMANHIWEGGEEVVNKNMLLGGVAGGLLGAAAALLLAPKAGMELIQDLAHPFSNQKGKARGSSRKLTARSTAHKKASRSSKSRTSSHREAAKTESNKAHKPSAKKKSSARRRTATATHKHRINEKSGNQVEAASTAEGTTSS